MQGQSVLSRLFLAWPWNLASPGHCREDLWLRKTPQNFQLWELDVQGSSRLSSPPGHIAHSQLDFLRTYIWDLKAGCSPGHLCLGSSNACPWMMCRVSWRHGVIKRRKVSARAQKLCLAHSMPDLHLFIQPLTWQLCTSRTLPSGATLYMTLLWRAKIVRLIQPLLCSPGSSIPKVLLEASQQVSLEIHGLFRFPQAIALGGKTRWKIQVPTNKRH